MEEFKYKVYVQVDNNNVIKRIESNILDIDFSEWIKIDEGVGEKYAHAQNYYLEKKLIDSNGNYNYKLMDNKPIELTEEEKGILFPVQTPQATEQQVLNAQLLQGYANMQLELEEQKQLNAQILLQIAGGVTNV